MKTTYRIEDLGNYPGYGCSLFLTNDGTAIISAADSLRFIGPNGQEIKPDWLRQFSSLKALCASHAGWPIILTGTRHGGIPSFFRLISLEQEPVEIYVAPGHVPIAVDPKGDALWRKEPVPPAGLMADWLKPGHEMFAQEVTHWASDWPSSCHRAVLLDDKSGMGPIVVGTTCLSGQKRIYVKKPDPTEPTLLELPFGQVACCFPVASDKFIFGKTGERLCVWENFSNPRVVEGIPGQQDPVPHAVDRYGCGVGQISLLAQRARTSSGDEPVHELHAVTFDSKRILLLADCVDNLLANRWLRLETACCINANGWILGVGIKQNGVMKPHIFRLTPNHRV